jgi:hypothetical protein
MNGRKLMFKCCIEMNNNSSKKIIISKDNQLTTVEKLALRRGLERVNRERDSQQAKIIGILDSLHTEGNFQDAINQSKLQVLFNTIQKLKYIYPSKKVLWKAPSNRTLPPYKSVRLENKILKRGLKKKCSLYPNKEKIIENWYKLMKVQENLG